MIARLLRQMCYRFGDSLYFRGIIFVRYLHIIPNNIEVNSFLLDELLYIIRYGEQFLYRYRDRPVTIRKVPFIPAKTQVS